MRKNAGAAKYCGVIAQILLISGCGNDPVNRKVTGGASPAPAVQSAAPDARSGAAAQKPAVPEDIMTFLNEGNIPNGDIYLDGSTVHVNIVGLNAEIERSFADRFAAGSYVLHEVNYTSQQLEGAFRLLDQDVHQRLNLYGAWIDVIQNKIGVTMPDDNAVKVQKELEQLIDPGMLQYDVSKIGDPHVTGEIVAIETGERNRILILEPGQEHPSYWFSVGNRAKMYDANGKSITFADLQKGQHVKLWNTGTVAESFPALASLRRLELDAE